ncbi:coiled-coil domain-containing protein 42 like-2-like [Homalodisca vitripennis]|uniref:coiled-coil domain-containing protein 42 like-2-like n=1 Tax=Homalodisca vitripennis TaxID=197043 RepID=UPI001EEA2A09|nr:coiled-coil domain-containing protein 42 like-2-like [Homalodisca vitripennis]
MRKELNESWKELKTKQNALKALHLEFEKLESEDKKTRAREKLEEEKKLQLKLSKQLENVKEEVTKLGSVEEQMKRHLMQYQKYEAYLSYVVQHNEEFSSVDEILDRYRILCNMQTELENTLESDLQFMIQSRNDIDDLTEEKFNMINSLCNTLAKVRVRAKIASENVIYWETLVNTVRTFIAEKTLELEMVRDAVWSLYMQMCRKHKVSNPVSKTNFEKQIAFIYKTILQYKQIVKIATRKSGETFHSNRPNSSVVSVPNH